MTGFNLLIAILLPILGGALVPLLDFGARRARESYVFAIVCVSIAWSLLVEQNLVKVQRNEQELQELRISYQQHTLKCQVDHQLSVEVYMGAERPLQQFVRL